ncbi:MAG: glycerol-3-phosphate 1-O-acyltransferase PlsY [Bdellovibrionota bacterium]
MSLSFFLLLMFAYLLGGVPFGLLWGRIFADIDVRDFGSGNIGATNVNRILGRKLGAATLLSDVLKSVLCVFLAKTFGMSIFEMALVGLAAVVGHCYPIYLRFRGGKGVATALGACLLITPIAAFVAVATWLFVFRMSRISALSALIAALILLLAALVETHWSISVGSVYLIMVIIILIRHKDNIQRMRKGVELSS